MPFLFPFTARAPPSWGAPAAERLNVVVHYRTFRNDDPPALLSLWNETFTGRGTVRLHSTTILEHLVFSKPYFDPAGLIVAVEDGVRVGFAHAGFGPNEANTGLSTDVGVLCLIGVRPTHRRRGVGSELLRRAEDYLRGKGAATAFAGGLPPYNPFYFGLYGGSDSAGFLASDHDAEPFLKKHGYRVRESCRVLQCRLDVPLNVVDARFAAMRRRYEMRTVPRSGADVWWRECVRGPLELVEFRLIDKGTQQGVASAFLWEIETFWQPSTEPAVGIVHVEVTPELRGQGLAKFLLSSILRGVQEQYFLLAEAHTREGDDAAGQLFGGLGFEQVDTGRLFARDL